MFAGGTDPKALSLRDWLNVAERHLMSSAGAAGDTILLDILHRMFLVESEEAMADAFTELRRLYERRDEEFKKAVAEQRSKDGLPQIVPKDQLDAIADEWTQIAEQANAQEAPAPEEG